MSPCVRRFLAGFALILAGSGAAAAPVRVGFAPTIKPLAFVDEEGRAAGYVADYVAAVARAGKFQVEFVIAPRPELEAMFARGEIAVSTGVVYSETRAETLAFTLPYLTLEAAVFGRRGGREIRAPSDLKGLRVAVVRANITHLYLEAQPEWGAIVVPLGTTEEALQAVQSGDCDAAVNLDLVARDIIRRREWNELRRMPAVLPDFNYKYHMIVRPGDDALLRRINEAQLAVHSEGEYARLYEKWIGPLEPPRLTWRAVRPLAIPFLVLLLAIAAALVWQRRNLNQLREQTEALRQNEERLSLVLASGRHSLWDWDVERAVVMRGPLLAEMLGYAPTEIAPTPDAIAQILHPEDQAAWDAVGAVLAGGEKNDFQVEGRMRTKAGGWCWIATSGRVLRRRPDGRALRAVGTHTDISRRREAEENVRRLNRDLERRVAERTEELAARVTEVEQLNRAQQRLVNELRASEEATARAAASLQETNARLMAANDELEAFSYTVSHDLRAPLRNIFGFAELLGQRAEKHLDGEGRRYLAVITREVKRMGVLIDDLLMFSRVGRTELQPGPVALAELVDEARGRMEADLAGRKIEWRIGPLPLVWGDRALLFQVVANLIDNAVKFTSARELAVIEVGAEPGRDEAGRVTVWVRDNGVGFDAKHSAMLFGVFQRLHSARDFRGTGIGLASVKRIVTRHGGKVWAEAEPDKGAVFYLGLKTAEPV